MSKNQTSLSRLRVELLQQGSSLGSYLSEAGEDQLILGSSKKADLVVPESNVSEIHAMLRLKDKHIHLYDLGSAEGTFVGGKRIVESELQHGAHFRMGSHELRVALLEDFSQDSTEKKLFWNATKVSGSDLSIDINFIVDHTLQTQYELLSGENIYTGYKNDSIPIGIKNQLIFSLKDGHCICALPDNFKAEVYDYQNTLLRSATSGSVQINSQEKLLLQDEHQELQIYWRKDSLRMQRLAPDADNKILQKSLLLSLAAAILFLITAQLLNTTPETIEEILKPESSYLRVTTGGGSPAPAENNEASNEKSEQAPAGASKAVSSVSSALNNILKKSSALSDEAIQQAVSKNGQQTSRAIAANSSMQKQSIQGNAIGAGISTESVSKGLQGSGSGGAKGLNGFAKGGAGVGGAGIGGNGVGGSGGSGFNLNVGGEEAEAIGGLDKALIAAVVQANLGQIKHCYEKQLLMDANLYGKVVAEWVIDKAGSVSKSGIKKTSMNNTNVENCIAGRIKNWKFPQPKGGGNVMVSYPFLFKSMN